jgi:hypothetical protein
MRSRLYIIALVFVLAAFAARAAAPQQGDTAANAAKDPAKLRAHDLHQDLLVAADPWADAEDYKAKFPKKSPFDAGVIAIDIYFRNDGPTPIQINLNTIRLTVAFSGQPEQNLPPLKPVEVANYMLAKDPGDPAKRRVQLPGHSGSVSKEMQKAIDDLRALQLSSDLVPPHGMVHGLFYFDLGGHFDWVSYCRVYVPDVKQMESDKALFFFDVQLFATKAP